MKFAGRYFLLVDFGQNIVLRIVELWGGREKKSINLPIKNKEGIDMFYQQGDTLIFKTDEMPKDAKLLEHKTLMEGELTGHAHRISKGLAELFENGTTKYLKVLSEEAVLTHEEHNQIVLPKGIYKIGRVREYDHFAEEARNVVD